MSSIAVRRNDERQPLLARDDEKGHYNLAGLSARHFWTLVRPNHMYPQCTIGGFC